MAIIQLCTLANRQSRHAQLVKAMEELNKKHTKAEVEADSLDKGMHLANVGEENVDNDE